MPELDREGRFSIHEMKAADIEPLADGLSEMDCRELNLLGVDRVDAMRFGFLLGSYVAKLDGHPVAAFGVNSECTPSAVWFLGSEDRFSFPMEFYKLSKRWVKLLCDDQLCGNIVPHDHEQTINWLKSLDFKFDFKPYNVHGHDFLVCVRRGPNVNSLPH